MKNQKPNFNNIPFTPINNTNTRITVPLLTGLFLLVFGLLSFETRGSAQSSPISQYTILHSFSGYGGSPSSDDGSNPQASMILVNGTLYGTTSGSGNQNAGILFKINLDGSQYENLHDFQGATSDAADPWDALIAIGGNLYGTTPLGGAPDCVGTIYTYSLDGSGAALLNSFTNTGAWYPECSLVQIGSTLYGTASIGGTYNNGTIFKINVDGTGYTNIYEFPQDLEGNSPNGAGPQAGLTLGDDNILYGTTGTGGLDNESGVIFETTTNGDYSVLFDFLTATNTAGDSVVMGACESSLLYRDGVLYGTTPAVNIGGYNAGSWFFRINDDGTGFTTQTQLDENGTSGVVMAGNKLYGITGGQGGSYGHVFRVDTNGLNFTNIYAFTNSPDGFELYGHQSAAPIIVTNGTRYVVTCCPDVPTNLSCGCLRWITITNSILYGTTTAGGNNEDGVIFGLPLSIAPETNEYDTGFMLITNPANNAVFYTPANIPIGVDVSNVTGVVEVDFYSDGLLLGVATNTPYAFDWTGAPLGTNVILAVGVNSSGVPVGSAEVEVIVDAGISTYAGKYSLGGTLAGDGGAATNAGLNYPGGLTIDGAGDLYIADVFNNVVRRVTPDGIITTVAGDYDEGGTYYGDGGAATNAGLNILNGLVVDGNGNLYIADTYNDVVRKVDTSGTITTFAGDNDLGGDYSGDGSAATGAALNFPYGLAVDSSDNIYIADCFNHVIRKVNVSTGVITTVAGDHSLGGGYSGDGGAATSAKLYYPNGIAFDASGNLYISDSGNNVIREVSEATGNITTVAGDHSLGGGYSGDGGAATSARLNNPGGVAVDGAGDLYIPDYYNSVIRKVDATGIITTVAGSYSLGGGYSGDGGAAISAALNTPTGVAVDSSTNVYISDAHNNVIRKVTN